MIRIDNHETGSVMSHAALVPFSSLLPSRLGYCSSGLSLRLLAAREGRRSEARPGGGAIATEGRGNCRSPTAYLAPLRQALIDKNTGHVNVVVCESDYHALRRGIGHLRPPTQ